MKFLERDLEDIIFEMGREKLQEKGIWSCGKMYRQLRIGEYGISDLVLIERPRYDAFFGNMLKGTITVMELKKDKLNVDSFMQAVRYVKGIKDYLYCRYGDQAEYDFNYRIVLIGRSICVNSAIMFLPDIFNFDVGEKNSLSESGVSVDIYTYNYTSEGIFFKEEGDVYL